MNRITVDRQAYGAYDWRTEIAVAAKAFEKFVVHSI